MRRYSPYKGFINLFILKIILIFILSYKIHQMVSNIDIYSIHKLKKSSIS
jgi:hypothetical protein